MIIRFLPEAEQELDYAIRYYNQKHKNLGHEFLDEIITGIEMIKFAPDAWQQISQNTKRYQIKRFPYCVIYSKINTIILIVAIANLKQKPNYWLNRNNI